MLDPLVKVNKKYYPQTLLEECKYKMKSNKMENLIDDDLDPSSSDNESDNEFYNESDNGSDSESDNWIWWLICLGLRMCFSSTMNLIVYSQNMAIHY